MKICLLDTNWKLVSENSFISINNDIHNELGKEFSLYKIIKQYDNFIKITLRIVGLNTSKIERIFNSAGLDGQSLISQLKRM